MIKVPECLKDFDLKTTWVAALRAPGKETIRYTVMASKTGKDRSNPLHVQLATCSRPDIAEHIAKAIRLYDYD